MEPCQIELLKPKAEKLSRHLPTALRQAVADVGKLMNDPRYTIDMGEWHYPIANDLCQVCAAGAWVAVEMGVPPECSGSPSTMLDAGFEHVRDMMQAINYVREGWFNNALKSVGVLGRHESIDEPEDWYGEELNFRGQPEFYDSWAAAMLERAEWLEKNVDFKGVV